MKMKQLFALVGASLALGLIVYETHKPTYTQLPMEEITLMQVYPIVDLPTYKVENERTSQV